jgi:hypothetical protein
MKTAAIFNRALWAIALVAFSLFNVATFSGCATPAGTRKLPGGDKAEVTEYRVPGTKWVLWEKVKIVKGPIASLVDFLKSVGHWFIIGGLVAGALGLGLGLGVQNRLVQTVGGVLLVGGAGAAGMGLIVSLLANPWVLIPVLVGLVALVVLGVFELFKNKDFSAVDWAKSKWQKQETKS